MNWSTRSTHDLTALLNLYRFECDHQRNNHQPVDFQTVKAIREIREELGRRTAQPPIDWGQFILDAARAHTKLLYPEAFPENVSHE